MVNIIRNIAIHDLQKDGTGQFTILHGADNVAVTPTVQRLVDTLFEIYGRRGSKSHGRFSDQDEQFPTQAYLRDYMADVATGFPAFTRRLMQTLRGNAQLRSAATGGHVFFAHFETDGRAYLLVTIVNDRLGEALTAGFKVSDIRHLDTQNFRFAGRINISGWEAGEAKYISFLKGKGDVAEYFKLFLGCDATSLQREDTKALVAAINAFPSAQNMTPEEKNSFQARTSDYLERHSRQNREIDFEAMANELMPDDPQPLKDLLFADAGGLNDNFVPNMRELRGLVKLEGRTASWQLQFDRNAIARGDVLYDEDQNSIILRDVPIALRDEILRERPRGV